MPRIQDQAENAERLRDGELISGASACPDQRASERRQVGILL